jgi:hypothetical protein
MEKSATTARGVIMHQVLGRRAQGTRERDGEGTDNRTVRKGRFCCYSDPHLCEVSGKSAPA